LIVAGLAVASVLIGGRLRIRLSGADAAILGLVTLVALSARFALDRRPAINLAWDWVGIGITYLLVRNLPRNRGESAAMAGILLAASVAVSTYGFYQARVELPQLQEEFRRNASRFLEAEHIAPGSAGETLFRNRLLYSNEVFSTFGLANSLAGFLVGPLVLAIAMGLAGVSQQEPEQRQPKSGSGSRTTTLLLAGLPLLVLLICLIATKSRSAWLGAGVGLAWLGWSMRNRVSRRFLLAALGGGAVLVGLLIAVGLASGRLDREVLTQSPMSLRYRLEYWQGAWGTITEGAHDLRSLWDASTFWWGVGPGNFGGPYLLHKLPQSSEEIQDPHNLLLEVWATAGIGAFLALIAAIGLGLRNLMAPSSADDSAEADRSSSGSRADQRKTRSSVTELNQALNDEAPPPGNSGWLFASAAIGFVLVFLVGDFNLFAAGMMERWLFLGLGWAGAVVLGGPLWRRVSLPVTGLAAGVLATLVHLLAAGGIGFTSVALSLWTLLAVGLNLRTDRPCGRVREFAGRLPAFVGSLAWAGILGTFVGTVGPHWNAEAALAEAEDAVDPRRPPNFQKAEAAYERAIRSDPFSARPWIGLGLLHAMAWNQRGARPDDLRWKQIAVDLGKAVDPPRNPRSWSLHSQRALILGDLYRRVGHTLTPRESLTLRSQIVAATRTASRLHPTNADLHARLAEASADISMFADAASEAREALRLDALTPHADKKLRDEVRSRLEANLPEWTRRGEAMNLPGL
jgi:O-antigen ligase